MAKILDYSYHHLAFRLNIGENDFSKYEPYFNGLKLPEYIEEPNAEKLLDNERALYHELSHYYQDIYFPACICERELKINILADYVQNASGKSHNNKKHNKRRELFDYLFMTKYCDDNLYSLSKNDEGIDFWAISYKDLLESYADIRASKTVFDAYRNEDEQIKDFIRNYILKRKLFHYDLDDNQLTTRLGDLDRTYAICKHVFLTLFSAANSRFCFNDSLNSFNRIKVDLANAFSSEKDERLFNLARNLDIFLLFCIEFALTLPSASFIEKSIEEGKDKRMFHPGCRFYSLIALIMSYPDTFNDLDFSANYVEVFDQISEACGLYKYEDVVKSLTYPNFPFSVIRHSHNLRLKETINVKIENRCNIDIMTFFKKTGNPIILWGASSQYVYVGDGNDKFDSFHYRGLDSDYAIQYLFSDVERMYNEFFGTNYNPKELKSMINIWFLQESSAFFLLNRCANSFLSKKKDEEICLLDCDYKSNDCLLFNIVSRKKNIQCDLTKLIERFAILNK